MEDEIIIGKLIIDNSDLNAQLLKSKNEIIKLEQEQKKLKQDTDNLSKANEEQLKTFIDNETQLKAQRAEYSSNQKSVLELTRAQTGLDDALKANVKTQNDAIANTSELIKARKQIDTTTVEGAKAIAEINAKINENNKLLNANNSELEQQKVNIGNYGNEFRTAASNMNPFNGGLSGFIDRSREAGGAGNLLKNSLGGVTTSIVGVTKASLAFVISPIGAVVTALVLVFLLVKNAMNKSEEATAKITKVFSIFSGIVNLLFKAIAPLGEFLIDTFVSALETVAEGVENLMSVISAGLRLLGLDGVADTLDGVVESTKESIKASQDLADAEKELDEARRKAKITQLQFQKVEERLRQKRDDTTLSLDKQIEANDELGRVLQIQLSQEIAIAQAALKFADARIRKEGQTKDALDARAEALTNIADIEERIIGQQSEQLANRVRLQQEADKKAKELAHKALQDSIKRSQTELEIFKLQAAASNLTTEQLLANAQKVFDLETALAKKSSTGIEQTKAILQARQNLSSSILSITQDQLTKESEAQKKAFEDQKATSQELLDSQRQSAQDLANAQLALLDKTLLSEKDFADQVIAIENAKNENILLARTNFDEAEKVRREAEIANQRAIDEVLFQIRLQDIQDRDATEQEIKQALLQANFDNELALLEASLSAQDISEDVFLAKRTLAEKKFRAETLKNDKILAEQKRALALQSVNDSISALQSLFGESKALSVASALVNTYQGISAGVKLGYPAAIPAVAAAAATGFAAVKNILKTNKGSSAGGSVASSNISTSGTANFVNTAQTETIARVSETPVEQNTVVTPPVLILESLQEVQNNVAVKIESN